MGRILDLPFELDVAPGDDPVPGPAGHEEELPVALGWIPSRTQKPAQGAFGDATPF